MSETAVLVDARAESKDPFEFLLNVTRRYGDAVRYDGQTGPTYLFNHPRFVKEVLQNPRFQRTSMIKLALGDGLLASDGDYWRKQRQLVQSLFHSDAVTTFEPIIQSHMRVMLDRWAEHAERGESLDVSAEMTLLTLSIIVDALFGVELGPRTRDLTRALMVLLDDLGAMGCTQLNTPLTFSASSRVRFQTAMRTVDEVVATIIEKRRRVGVDRVNFMSVLLGARDGQTGKHLTDRQIRDEVVSMLIAGHETTAMVLSWSWSLLATNPSVEQSLHREVDRVLGARTPKLEDLGNLPYTVMVLQESMRLYPPVWFIARKATSAGDVGGVDVPENVLVIVSPFAIHRHPDFWNSPDDFNPTRFSAGNQQAKHSYIPFGAGRHLCLGMHLALMEGSLLLAGFAQRYVVRPASERIRLHPAITLRLRDGLMAAIHEREAQKADT